MRERCRLLVANIIASLRRTFSPSPPARSPRLSATPLIRITSESGGVETVESVGTSSCCLCDAEMLGMRGTGGNSTTSGELRQPAQSSSSRHGNRVETRRSANLSPFPVSVFLFLFPSFPFVSFLRSNHSSKTPSHEHFTTPNQSTTNNRQCQTTPKTYESPVLPSSLL